MHREFQGLKYWHFVFPHRNLPAARSPLPLEESPSSRSQKGSPFRLVLWRTSVEEIRSKSSSRQLPRPNWSWAPPCSPYLSPYLRFYLSPYLSPYLYKSFYMSNGCPCLQPQRCLLQEGLAINGLQFKCAGVQRVAIRCHGVRLHQFSDSSHVHFSILSSIHFSIQFISFSCCYVWGSDPIQRFSCCAQKHQTSNMNT